MQTANTHGVYEADTTEELARCGRSYAAIRLCQCDDGLYRYSLDVMYSYGGFSGPISNDCQGFSSMNTAREAATQDLLERFPKAWAADPQSVHDELRALRAQVERHHRQPSLF